VPFYGDDLLDFSNEADFGRRNADVGIAAQSFDAKQFLKEYLTEVADQPERGLERIAIPSDNDSDADFRTREVDPDLRKKEIQNWPPIEAIARFIDDKFPSLTAFIISQVLRTVHVYLASSIVRKTIDECIREKLTSKEPMMVVAHSLGSVISFNVLSQMNDLAATPSAVRARQRYLC
jgi:hypothetical protein